MAASHFIFTMKEVYSMITTGVCCDSFTTSPDGRCFGFYQNECRLAVYFPYRRGYGGARGVHIETFHACNPVFCILRETKRGCALVYALGSMLYLLELEHGGREITWFLLQLPFSPSRIVARSTKLFAVTHDGVNAYICDEHCILKEEKWITIDANRVCGITRFGVTQSDSMLHVKVWKLLWSEQSARRSFIATVAN